jgi:hypothetical protein
VHGRSLAVVRDGLLAGSGVADAVARSGPRLIHAWRAAGAAAERAAAAAAEVEAGFAEAEARRAAAEAAPAEAPAEGAEPGAEGAAPAEGGGAAEEDGAGAITADRVEDAKAAAAAALGPARPLPAPLRPALRCGVRGEGRGVSD